MGKQSTPMVRDSYEAEFRIMRNELESAKQVTANALIEYSRIRDINADLLDALEGAQKALRTALPFLPADKEAHFVGEWLDAVNAAIARARGQA